MTRLRRFLSVSMILGAAQVAAADPPTGLPPAVYALPAPGRLPLWSPGQLPLWQSGQLPLLPPDYPPPQPSVRPEFGRMSIWGAYAPDITGRFRPVVIQAPGGFTGYYRINGEPFPWTTNWDREYMPYVVD